MISKTDMLAISKLIFLAGQLSTRRRTIAACFILIAAAEHIINPHMSSRGTTVGYDNEILELEVSNER